MSVGTFSGTPMRSCSSRMAQDVKTEQESLRHSTVKTTMETYTQAIPEHARQAQERVSEQLLAAAGNVQLPVVVL